jgi:hypothetical protein
MLVSRCQVPRYNTPVFGEGHVYPSHLTCKKIHTKNVHTCQEVMQKKFEKSWDKKEIFLQVNWHSTFAFIMASHAMSYNMSSSNITCHVTHASHVMISHAHMHITFMACICSQHCTMTCTTPIFLLPYNSKKLPHVRKTAPYDLCSWVVTRSWVRQHYQGMMSKQQCITLYIMWILFCHDKHWCYTCLPCHSHITSITSLGYTVTFFPCYT